MEGDANHSDEEDDEGDDGEENDLEGFEKSYDKIDDDRADINEYEPNPTKKKIKGAFDLQTGDYSSGNEESSSDHEAIDDYSMNANEYV